VKDIIDANGVRTLVELLTVAHLHVSRATVPMQVGTLHSKLPSLRKISLLGPFYGAIAVPSVMRCRCRCCCCGHRRAAARSGEWAQHFSNASCLVMQSFVFVLYLIYVCLVV